MELINGYLLQQFQREFDYFKMRLMEIYKERNPSTIVDYNENHLPEKLFNLSLINLSQRETLNDFLKDANQYTEKGVYIERKQSSLLLVLERLRGQFFRD